MSVFHIFWTVALFVIFIGIVFWAFNRRRKDDFDEASRLPLEDEGQQYNTTENTRHG